MEPTDLVRDGGGLVKRNELVLEGKALGASEVETLARLVCERGEDGAAKDLGIHKGTMVRALAQVVPVSRLSVLQIRHALEVIDHGTRPNRASAAQSEGELASGGQATGGNDEKNGSTGASRITRPARRK
jgi:hypothetical protein